MSSRSMNRVLEQLLINLIILGTGFSMNNSPVPVEIVTDSECFSDLDDDMNDVSQLFVKGCIESVVGKRRDQTLSSDEKKWKPLESIQEDSPQQIEERDPIFFDEQLVLAHRDIICPKHKQMKQCSESAIQRDNLELSPTDRSTSTSPKIKKSSAKKVAPSMSEEQFLKMKKREVDAAKALMKREESKDRVALLDCFIPESETLEIGDKHIFDFESHLINTGEYPLVLVWRWFVHSQKENGTIIGYYGDMLGMLIAGMGPLSGYLMVPHQEESEKIILEELAQLIEKMLSFDKIPRNEHLWKNIVSELRTVMSPLIQMKILNPSIAHAAHHFLRYITAATVVHQKQGAFRYEMALPMGGGMLKVLRSFLLVTWRVITEQLLQNLESTVTNSLMGQQLNNGFDPNWMKLKQILPRLRVESQSMQHIADRLLSPSCNVSAEQLSNFMIETVSRFDNRLARLDSVLGIGQAIHHWRGMGKHGIIAVSTAAIGGGSWEIDQMLQALGEKEISREWVYYHSVRGYYKKPFTKSSLVEGPSPPSKSKSRRERRKNKGSTQSKSEREADWIAYCNQELS